MQASRVQSCESADYTPVGAVSAGQVVVRGAIGQVAERPIAAGVMGALAHEGQFDFVKAAVATTDGQAIYWDADGNPVGGTAGSGAATNIATANTFLGFGVGATLEAGTTVRVLKCCGAATISNTYSAVLENAIADPGNAGAIPVATSGYCPIVTAGAETRTIAAPANKGQLLLVYMKTDAGDCVVTVATGIDQAGSTTITLNDVGDAILLVAVESGANIRWRTVFSDGGIAGHGLLEDLIADPGDAGAIPVTRNGHVEIVTTAAQTRTLAAPSFLGQQLLISLKTDGGDGVITCATTVNQTGNNTITLNDAGDAVLLVAKANGANLRWSVVVNDGSTLSTV